MAGGPPPHVGRGGVYVLEGGYGEGYKVRGGQGDMGVIICFEKAMGMV